MKLELARGAFLVGALGVASLALAAWDQPGPQVLRTEAGQGLCATPRVTRGHEAARPDHDLLLLMFGLAQGSGPKG